MRKQGIARAVMEFGPALAYFIVGTVALLCLVLDDSLELLGQLVFVLFSAMGFVAAIEAALRIVEHRRALKEDDCLICEPGDCQCRNVE